MLGKRKRKEAFNLTCSCCGQILGRGKVTLSLSLSLSLSPCISTPS